MVGSGLCSHQLVFPAKDMRNFHVVGRGRQIFKFLSGKDVNSDEMDLCMSVFSSLGSRHVDNFARTTFDDHESVLPQCRTLHGKGRRCTGIGAFEMMLMLLE